MFNSQTHDLQPQGAKSHVNQDIKRGLTLLIIIAVSVIGSSWLFSLPVYFDIKIAAQIFPLLFSIVLLFTVTRLQHNYVNVIAAALAYLFSFICWSYVFYLNTILAAEKINKDPALAQLSGMSDSMYLLGLCLLSLWLGRYFKYAVYLSSASIISLVILLLVFSNLSMTLLVALLLLLISSVVIASSGFSAVTIRSAPSSERFNKSLHDDLLLPSEIEEQLISPELEINAQPLNEDMAKQDWELILRELHGELKNTSDVDQLFKRMLVFLHGAIEYDAAAVGMVQDKNIKKIALYGDDQYLHSPTLNWTGQRLKELFASRRPALSKQTRINNTSAELTQPLHRIDIPVISNQKPVGLVTIYRQSPVFDTHDVQLAASIVFHSMIALRLARLHDEVKRLSSESVPTKLTLYTREQFVTKVKPVFDKLGKPRECSLFIVEIDNLDTVTDTIARDAGSLLYKTVSKTIQSQLKSSDILGAYGKEGFIVMLDESSLMQAKSVAETIREKVSQLKIKYQDNVISSTVSIGLTIISKPDESLSSVMRKADMGLFVAKENGCNSIKVSL